MKTTISILLACFLVTTARGEWFLHRSTPANSTNNYTLLAPHLTNQLSTDLFIFPIQRPYTPKHLDRSLGTWLDEGISFSGNGETQTYPTAVVLPSQFYRVARTLE